MTLEATDGARSDGLAFRRPAATVAVCTRARPEFLPDCLKSIDTELEATDELIVVEDGCSHAHDALAPLSCLRRHVRSDDTTKTSKMNEALRLASHEFVLFTDDDCRVPT